MKLTLFAAVLLVAAGCSSSGSRSPATNNPKPYCKNVAAHPTEDCMTGDELKGVLPPAKAHK